MRADGRDPAPVPAEQNLTVQELGWLWHDGTVLTVPPTVGDIGSTAQGLRISTRSQTGAW